jgi:hypothetical protein
MICQHTHRDAYHSRLIPEPLLLVDDAFCRFVAVFCIVLWPDLHLIAEIRPILVKGFHSRRDGPHTILPGGTQANTILTELELSISKMRGGPLLILGKLLSVWTDVPKAIAPFF